MDKNKIIPLLNQTAVSGSVLNTKPVYIDDLSFSGLVSLIDGNESIAADALDSIAQETDENKEKIKKLEKELDDAKTREGSLIAGKQRIMQHLKKEYPLVVQRSGYIVIVTEKNISIERNVLQTDR